MSTSAAHPSPGLRRSSPSAGRIAALIAGSLLALLAAALILGGVALVAPHLTQRDDDGFYTSPSTRLATGTYALTGEGIDLGDVRRHRRLVSTPSTRRRVSASTQPATRRCSSGSRRDADVQAYLRGVAHDQVQDVDHRDGDLIARYERVPGAGTPQPPGSQRFWVASSSGAGTQTLEWEPRSGRWAVVVMRADGRAA